jgi:hypothetical protein
MRARHATFAAALTLVCSASAEAQSRDPDVDRQFTVMREHLRTLMAAQEIYYSRNNRYAVETGELATQQYRGVPVYGVLFGYRVDILKSGVRGWGARVRSTSLPGKTCVAWVGAEENAVSTADGKTAEPGR